MRKDYCRPEVRAEQLAVGVFGCYGNNPGSGGSNNGPRPVGFLFPLFGICCGGGS